MKWSWAFVAAVLAAPSFASPPSIPGDLSVMSYNVHGLPWPITDGRRQALRLIGARLATMRQQGIEPKVVLLQEAFSGSAKAIARESQYPYVIEGPRRAERSAIQAEAGEYLFARGDKRLKGEGDGKFEDSGLLILSDYPIIEVQRMPYASYACAGYDCLANKGAVLVRIAVPGAAQPVAILDTHLNSRGASGVARSRADLAYGWQAEELRSFVANNIPLASPAIVAGDFNIGQIGYRRAMITGGAGVLPGSKDALRTAIAEGLKSPDEAAAESIVRHGKDWMFGRSGASTVLTLERVTVPFGREPDGKSLSDHFGYVAYYRID